MKVKVYWLYLFKFADDKIVFYKRELEKANDEIRKCLRQYKKFERKGAYYVYELCHEEFSNKILDKVTIELAQLGYYHHRAIVYFNLDAEGDFSLLRGIREETGEIADKLVNYCVKKKINELVDKKTIREEGEIRYLYRYPLIVVENGIEEHDIVPFSDQTTSMCFEVIEPSWWPPSGKKYLMRISIPKTILYTRKDRPRYLIGKVIHFIGKVIHFIGEILHLIGETLHLIGEKKPMVSESLLRSIINAIYQYCLYEKKLQDENGPFDTVLDETLLVRLWEHAIDTMGGKTADVYIARIACITFFVTFSAFLVALIAFILSVLQFIGWP